MFWLPLSVCVFLTAQDPAVTEPKWEQLHPALIITRPDLEKIWDRGYKEAEKKPDPKGFLVPIHRDLEKVRGQAASWAWLMNPETVSYLEGFHARKQYLPDAEKEDSRRKATGIELQDLRTLHFHGIVSSYLKFGGRGGTVNRPANASELENVRMVLKVGDRIYQPVQQPGKLEVKAGNGTSVGSITNYGTAYTPNPGWTQPGTTTTVTTTSRFAVDYEFYEARFHVKFDLFEKDGSPRIGAKDKEFTLIVVYGEKERRATYKLADLAKMRR